MCPTSANRTWICRSPCLRAAYWCAAVLLPVSSRPGKPRASARWRHCVLDWDTWQEVWATLRSNKLRAFLTALGVFWGVFMLILMLGIGNGLERGVTRNLSGLTTYSVYVWSQRTSIPYKGLQ